MSPRSFEEMWAELEPIGRDPRTGGYPALRLDAPGPSCGSGSAVQCATRGLDLSRTGWATSGVVGGPRHRPGAGVVTGSHLDSVPDGGAFDGPLGVVSALAAVDELRRAASCRRRPVAVVNFVDEEGARSACRAPDPGLIAGPAGAGPAAARTTATGSPWPRPSAAGQRVRSGWVRPRGVAADRLLRRAARRAGPGAVTGSWPSPSARGSGRTGAGASTSRRGQPRRHHPVGRPPGRDARFRRVVLAARAVAAERGCLATVGKVGSAGWRERNRRGGDRMARRPGAARKRSSARSTRSPHGWPITRHGHRGVVDAGHDFVASWSRPSARASRRAAARHRGRARRRCPGRRGGPGRDAVRPQPHRGVPLARGVRAEPADCLAPGSRRWRPSSPTWWRARMTELGYWAEQAWRICRRGRRRVQDEVVAGRISARDRGCAPDPATNGWPGGAPRAGKRRTATPSTGPCAAEPTTTAAPSGPGASGCTTSPADSTRTAIRRSATAVYAALALAGYTVVGEFHYLHHAPAAALPRPERHGTRS